MSLIKKKTNFICSFIREDTDIDDNPIQVFDKPKCMICTINSLSAEYDIAMYGDKIHNMQKAMLDYDKWINKIKVKDVVYLFGASPKGETVHGENANYRVCAVLPQNLKILVYFERRT